MVSGDLTSIGFANWGLPGLVAPEAMTLTFSGMVATVGLPSPWGVFSSGGVVVRAHGVQTGQDTQSYTVSFSPLIPSSGSVTAYLVATITQIQQTPYPIPGPPPGHPAYNPNTIPTIGYAQQVYTTALAAVTGSVVDNINTFELMRTTLTAGQSSVTTWNTLGQFRVPDRDAWPAELLTSGGSLAPGQAQTTMVFTAPGITVTLPPASGAGGLMFGFSNPLTVTGTVAITGSDLIAGFVASGGVSSVIVPASGAVTLWANAASGQWEITGFSPSVLLDGTNTWTGGENTFTNNVAIDGTTYFGSTGNFSAFESGSNQILQFEVGQQLVFNPSTGFNLNTTGDIGLQPSNGVANFTLIGQSFTAANATLRASLGAYNSGDNARCVLLGDFAFGVSVNGYSRLPNGMIMQWGQMITNGFSQQAVSYPITFPNSVFAVVATLENSTTAIGGVAVYGGTNSGFDVGQSFTGGQSGGLDVFWIATGW